MRFPPSLLDEIKARLPTSQVVGRRVKLTKAGREWKGLSPFNAEKSPSFFVNDVKMAWFDFSSGKNGNIFDFVMLTEGLSFPETVERLAAEAGVILPKITREAQEQEQKRQSLHDVMELAAQVFAAQLGASGGRRCRDYLAGRGLGPETQQRFRLGYAPNERFALRDALAAKGVTVEAMIEAGLLIHGEDIAVPYDRFRDRAMFPIADVRGRIIAFGGRALEKDVPAKYLNSPETVLFHKGGVLYNHHAARKAAHDRGRVIAVEGYVDVIALSEAGFPETVAPLGTALTEQQLGLLWRMSDEPILCFDGDGAGRRAAFRAVGVALAQLQPGKSLRFAFLPEGQDPDDLARSAGAAAVEGVLAAAKPLADVLWAREAEAGPMDTPERRAAFERRVRDLVATIPDPVTRRHYEAEMSERLGAMLRPARAAGAQRGRRGETGRDMRRTGWGERPAFEAMAPLTPSVSLSRSTLFTRPNAGAAREALIALALHAHPDLAESMADDLADADFSDLRVRRLVERVLDDVAASGPRHTDESDDPGRLLRDICALLHPGDAALIAPDNPIDEVEPIIRNALALHQRASALNSELRDAERALAADATEANFAWLQDVLMRMNATEPS